MTDMTTMIDGVELTGRIMITPGSKGSPGWVSADIPVDVAEVLSECLELNGWMAVDPISSDFRSSIEIELEVYPKERLKKDSFLPRGCWRMLLVPKRELP